MSGAARQKNTTSLFSAATVMLAAVALGLGLAVFGERIVGLSAYIGLLPSFGETASKADVFAGALLKYGALALLVWCLGFARKFCVLAAVPLAVRGLSAGFVFGGLVAEEALAAWFCFCFPQTVLLLPTYVFLTKRCFEFGFDPLAERRKMPEYVMTVIISVALVTLASLCEAFVSPALAGLLLN